MILRTRVRLKKVLPALALAALPLSLMEVYVLPVWGDAPPPLQGRVSLQNLADVSAGEKLYLSSCKSCHVASQQQDPPLDGASKTKLKFFGTYQVMVSTFKTLSETDYNNLAAYIASKDPRTYGISGSVKTTNNFGFSGVKILITSEYNNGATITAGRGGSYQITGLRPGDYTVTPVDPAFTFVPQRLVRLDFVNLFPGANEPVQSSFDQSGTVSNVNFTAQPPLAISGFVKTRAGAGLSGVTVSVPGRTGVTDINGHYALTNLNPGTYSVTASAAGLAFVPTNTTVAVNGPVDVEFLGGPPLVYVRSDGNNSNDGTSWAKAKATVQAGIDAGLMDVWVAKGTYIENIALQSGILLYGGFAGTETAREQRDPLKNLTILDGGHNNRVVDMLSLFDNGKTVSVIDGFSITNGVNQGAGIRVRDTGQTVSNNLIAGNQSSGTGGGIWVSGGSPLIAGNRITGNSAASGGGAIYSDGSPTILNNILQANTTLGPGGGISTREGTITGNIIASNAAADAGGGIYCSFGAALIAGNTIVGNTNKPTAGGGIHVALGASPTLVNNIVAFNSSGIARTDAGAPVLKNNCVSGNPGFNYSGLAAGSSDISADPKFVNAALGDLHLQPGSPCVDAGDDTAVSAGALDIDGQPRVQGPHVDIGADELKTDFDAPVLADGKADPFIVGTAGGTVTISVTATDNVGVVSAAAAITIAGGVPQTVDLTLSSGTAAKGIWQGQFTIPSNAGGQPRTYQIVFSAKDQAANKGFSSELDVVQSVLNGTLAVVRVSTTGDDNNDGSSWDKAKRTITAGINQALQEVWVAKGTYLENISLLPGLGLYGGFSGVETSRNQRNSILNETILDGIGNRVVVMQSAYDNGLTKSVVDGFTITNGSNQGAGLWVRDSGQTVSNNRIIGNHAGGYGGGIWVSGGSPLILNNRISGNSAPTGGGGIYCDGSPIILNNVITGNTTAGPGGGVSIREGTLTGNIIANNTAITGGGGVYCSFGTALISNNTIADNVSRSAAGGGIHCAFGAMPAIANNIVAFNSSGIASAGAGVPTLQHNCLFSNSRYDYSGLKSGSGDIAADPLFVDPGAGDYHLLPASACIDAGSDTVVQLGSVDLDGEPRLQGAHVDIGADESNPAQAKTAKAPHIIVQPDDQTVPTNSPAGFSVAAAGTMPLSYQWTKDGTQINGATSASYTASMAAQVTDMGQYAVVINNPYGSVTSVVATLTVAAPVFTNVTVITFDELPDPAFGGTVVPDGYKGLHWEKIEYANALNNEFNPSGFTAAMVSPSNVGFNNSFDGTASISSAVPFRLLSGFLTAALNDNLNVELTGVAGGEVVKDSTFVVGPTKATLIDLSAWPAVERVDFTASGGTAHFQPLGSGNLVMDNLAITYPPPHVDSEPVGRTVVPDVNVNFKVTASGMGPITYQWRKDGVAIQGSTNASLQLFSAQSADAGGYSVDVISPYGFVSSEVAVLAVATNGTLITFDDLPEPGFPGSAVPEGYKGLHWEGLSYVNSVNNEYNPSGLTAGVISSSNLVFNTSFDGTANLTSAVPFHFVSGYLTAEWNDDLQVEVTGFSGGGVVDTRTFVVSATKATLMDLSLWPAVDRVDFKATGGTTHFLPLGAGNFVLDNLTVILPPPHIDEQPKSQMVGPGGTATFNVSASGAQPLTYQWRKDGIDISGGTNALYMIPSVQASDAGGYSVMVANSYGTVTSAVAVLTIGNGGGGGGGGGGAQQVPKALANNGNFGFKSGQFGFDLSGAAGQKIVIEGSADLVKWLPMATNTLANGLFHFSDPGSKNLSRRFYRARNQ